VDERTEMRCTAFAGARRIASGTLPEVAVAARHALEEGAAEPLLVFDDATGRVVDLDLRGTARGRGRPRLGVVSREVTLLPRHWGWLATQRGGASATLRRLVDEARRGSSRQDRVRRAQDAAYRFMSAVGGDLPGYEEALRALFAGDVERFERHTSDWPADIRDHSRSLAEDALSAPASTAPERTDGAR